MRDILRETDKTVEIQILYVYGGNKGMIKIAILDDEEEALEKEEQIHSRREGKSFMGSG